jgi:hypothetical protein
MIKTLLAMGFEPIGMGIYVFHHSKECATIYNSHVNRLTTVMNGNVLDELVPETIQEMIDYVEGKGGKI